jgi:7,8-dihydropterin-6-yl-methyl-4-(beta-D-ribofuranosyl)aminobenzene 5'-phosphate synthase
MVRSFWLIAAVLALPVGGPLAAEPPNRVTVLYDAFGKDPAMKKDWGFSALVEYGGKRVLFDTGNDVEIFAKNVKAAGVDIKNLDSVVISHRHLDHTAGLSHLLSVNPGVKIYVPLEVLGGVFGTSAPSSFYRRNPALPQHMRYFDDHPPERIVLGTAWVGARFEHIDKTQEIAPGMFLISTVSDTPGTKEMRELSLAIRTPGGIALVVGCSHPGIERIVEAATAIDKRVRMVFGGFHLPAAKDEDVSRIATALHDNFKVEKLAPGHCTGEPAFALFQKTWGPDYVYAGVGSVIALP